MKKTFKLSGMVIIFLMIVTKTNQVFAQYSASAVVSVMKDKGWSLSNNRYAFLKEGVSTDWWSATFHSGTEYAVVAFSNDEDVEDIDLEVAYPSGTPYKSDVDPGDFAMVTFTPPVSRTYKIRMKNESSETPAYASECRYLVFYR